MRTTPCFRFEFRCSTLKGGSALFSPCSAAVLLSRTGRVRQARRHPELFRKHLGSYPIPPVKYTTGERSWENVRLPTRTLLVSVRPMVVAVVVSPGELLHWPSVDVHVCRYPSGIVLESSRAAAAAASQTFHMELRQVQKNLLLPVQSLFHE